MKLKIEKPYVLRVAEFIYFKIIEIKNKNPETNNIQAFEIFMTSKEYEFISSGDFHDKWFESCLLYTSPSPRDKRQSRMPSSA